MKVSDIRRKLARTLIGCGMLAPAAIQAAPLDTNLIVNPGFESIDFAVVGAYGSRAASRTTPTAANRPTAEAGTSRPAIEISRTPARGTIH
jgi:hypothetical protein